MRQVWQARPSFSLSRPRSIGNWRRQTTPSSGISITLIGISIGINTSVSIGKKWENSPREICPSASVRMRGRDILPPSFHNHTDHWGNQQRSAKISGKSDQIRSTSSAVLQQTDLADLSLASSSCWVFCSEPESRSAPSRAPIPVEPEDAQHPPANSSSDKILRQNAGPVPGQSSIMGREGGRRGNKNCRQIWRMNYNWLADTGGNEMIIWLENEITYNLHLHSSMKITQDDLNRKYKAPEKNPEKMKLSSPKWLLTNYGVFNWNFENMDFFENFCVIFLAAGIALDDCLC